MAGYLVVRNEVDKFTAADILALAAQIKRRKVKPTTRLQFVDCSEARTLEVRVPIRLKVTPVPAAPVTVKKSPMRGAKKGKH